MRFIITLILLLTALPAMADTLTVSVNRNNGATDITEPLVLNAPNIGAQPDLAGVSGIEVNQSGTGERTAYIDFHASDNAAHSDYSSRITRSNTTGQMQFLSNITGGSPYSKAFLFSSSNDGNGGIFSVANGMMLHRITAPTNAWNMWPASEHSVEFPLLGSGGSYQGFAQWLVSAGPTPAQATASGAGASWGIIGEEVNTFDRNADPGYKEDTTGRWSAGIQMVPESELNIFGGSIQQGYHGNFGVRFAHSSAPEYGDSSRTYPAAKWHIPLLFDTDSTTTTGTTVLFKGGASSGTKANKTIKATGHHNDFIDTSGATVAGAVFKVAPAQTFTDGIITKTLAQLSQGATQTKTCAGTDKFSAYDAATGQFSCSADQGGTTGATLTVQEVDGNPSGIPSTLKVQNGTLTDNGDGSYTINNNILGTATATSVTASGATIGFQVNNNGAAFRLKDDDDATNNSHLTVQDADINTAALTKVTSTGYSLLDIVAKPSDGTSTATVRMFRTTNTTGRVSLDVLKGDNTSTIGASISGNANSYVSAAGGYFGVGTSTPSSKLGVAGAVTLNNMTAPSQTTDRVTLYNVEGDYLHILDEDGNDHKIGQGTVEAKTFTPTIPAATTYGATTTIDLSLGDSPSVTLAGNPTLAFSNPKAGQWHVLDIIQGTGGNTVTWPSTGLVCTWRNADGSTTAPTLLSAAGAHNFFLIHTKSTTAADCFAR